MIHPSLITTGIISWMLVFCSCTFDPAGIPDFSQTNNENTDADTNEFCGNNIREGSEVCDGTDLAGQTCISIGYNFGDLACLEDCSGFDTSACISSTCGNNIAEYGEVCDGTDLKGESCETQGFSSGELACLPDCSGFDTSACEGPGPVCGNDNTEGSEVCDGTDLAGETCVSQGFYSGTLGCLDDCSDFDTSDCSGYCGDGIVNGDEECDINDLGGLNTCADHGCRSNGIVRCNDDCTFDISECISGHDEDGDDVDDNCDNCPSYYNPDQTDSNDDGIGDVCEYPDDDDLLSEIVVFDPFLNEESSWTNLGGSWTYGADTAEGSRIDYVGQLVHDHYLPNSPYGVETTFYYNQAPPENLNLAGAAFAQRWMEGLYAYMCVFNRISTAISIWRISGSTSYDWLAGAATYTTATDSDWRKIHVFYNGTSVICNYSDQTGTQASLQISGSTDVWNDMSGRGGLALSNEHAVFTSFVIYQ